MSESVTALLGDFARYVASHTASDDAFLESLKEAAHLAGLPKIAISPEQASFLRILMKISGAREVVEVGTLGGYSAIHMARGLPEGGRVRTIEIEEAHAEFAKFWVRQSDVEDRVSVLRGSGVDVLPSLETDSADVIFVDADKSNYPTYLREAKRIVRSGGLLLFDNAFAFGQLFDENPTDVDAPAIIAFNEIFARESGLDGIIVPFGDGMWVATLA